MRAVASWLFVLASLAAAPAGASDWNFRVFLDDREIGRHVFKVRTTGVQQQVTSEARFAVRILSIPAWRYDHRAVEGWDDGCLRSLDASTVTNGERISVVARGQGERLTVERPEGRDEHLGCLMSFAYWDPRILEATRLLNSQTGELMPVEIQALGTETLEVLGRERVAERHRIAGRNLQIDLWYADGRWIALEALAPGGRVLRYELTDERPS